MHARLIRLSRIPSFMPLAGTTLMLGVAMSFTLPFLSLFGVEQARMQPLDLGVFMTLIAASGVVASTWTAKWSDRRRQHRAPLLGALLSAAVGFLCLCVVRNYWLLSLIGVIFLGAGGSALSMVFSFSRAALQVRDEAERTFATAMLRTVLSIAWVFGPSVGALVLAVVSFQGLFLFAAACFMACALIVWQLHETPKRTQTHAAGERPSSSTVVTLIEQETLLPASSSRVIWRPVLALTLIGLATNATIIVLPLYVVRGMHGTRIDVSIMLGLGALLEIPMMLVLGARGASFKKSRWLTACAAVHVVYFIGVAISPSTRALIPMQALSAFVVAVISCLGMTYIQDLMPQSPAAATVLFFNASRVGSILSGVLSGVLVARVGYQGTFVCCGCLASVAFILLAFADTKVTPVSIEPGRAVDRSELTLNTVEKG